MLDTYAEQQLTGRGDTSLHFHLEDRVPTHDTVVQLQLRDTRRTVSDATYTVTEADDVIMCTVACTVSMPVSKGNGREFEVVMSGTGNVLVDLAGSDAIYGEGSVLLNMQGMALRFKAISGGWIII